MQTSKSKTKVSEPRPLLWLVVLGLSLHAAKIYLWFRQIDFGSAWPIVNVDYVLYYGRALRFHELFLRTGQHWGYDPYEMAGYVCGPIHEAGNFLFSIICHTFSNWIPIGRTLLWIELGGFIVMPFFFLGFIRLVRGTWNQAWIGFILITLGFGFLEEYSAFLRPIGLFGFFLGCFAGFFQIGLVMRWLEVPNWKQDAGVIAITCLMLFIHPTSAVVVFMPLVIFYAFRFSSLPRSHHLHVAIALSFVIFINWIWIHPMLEFADWVVPVPYMASESFQRFWMQVNPFQGDAVRSLGAFFHLGILFFSGRALWYMNSSEQKRAWRLVFVGWALFLAFLGLWGSHFVWFKNSQPLRFWIPFWFILYAVIALEWKESWPCGTQNPLSRKKSLIAGCLGIAGLIFGTWPSWQAFQNKLPDFQTHAIDFIKAHGPLNGRFLLESGDRIAPHFADIIPSLTKQAMLGGPNPGAMLVSRYTVFTGKYWNGKVQVSNDPQIFGRSLSGFSEQEFCSELDTYNVRMIGVWSSKSKEFLDSFSSASCLKKKENYFEFSFYTVKGPGSWLLEGQGDVSFDYNEIRIAHPTGPKLLLKFHWIKTLKVDSPIRIFPVSVRGDPVPFIGLDNFPEGRPILIKNGDL